MSADKSNYDSRKLDAYFIDEYAVQNTTSNTQGNNLSSRIGLFKNRFTINNLSPQISEEFETSTFDLANKADPKANPNLNKSSPTYIKNPIEAGFEGLTHQGDFAFSYYFSKQITNYIDNLKSKNQTWNSKIIVNLTVLFGPRNILNRSGVRTFFEKTSNYNAILQVPGVEPDYFVSNKKSNTGRWGVSITDVDIKNAFKTHFNIDIPFKIVVLAAYSTGANGLNQTILNNIFSLNDLKRVIFFDCLYETSSGNTIDTIKKIKVLNASAQIIIYWASSPFANTLTANQQELSVVQKLPTHLSNSQNVIRLQGNHFYRYLTCCRIISAGIKDGAIVFNSDNDKQKFTQIESFLPVRGTIISDKAKFLSINKVIPPNTFILADLQTKFGVHLTSFLEPYIAKMHQKKLLGWASSGGEMHDLLIPEFGWEYLPY